MDERQLAEQAARWAKNPYSYADLFASNLAVRVKDLLAHLEGCNLTHEQAIGWMLMLIQTRKLEVVSLDLVKLRGQDAAYAASKDAAR